jgi:mRNA deadenylase 3'-5' endonuclease subunit Ccr4
MPFTVASYNILADSYIKPEYYPGIPAAVLAPQSRHSALVRHILALNTDVIGLQEVEPEMFRVLEQALQLRGYVGHYAPKTGKPDGCATFVRTAALAVQAISPLRYTDGGGTEPDSGHIALIAELTQGPRRLVVANTHLKWDKPGTPVAQQRGHRQISQLVRQRQAGPGIVCGDFNVTPESEVAGVLRQAGWIDVYRDRQHMRTCISNRRARRIDYLWHTAELCSRPLPVRSISDQTVLPSAEEPSDHLAISAWFDWAEATR